MRSFLIKMFREYVSETIIKRCYRSFIFGWVRGHRGGDFAFGTPPFCGNCAVAGPRSRRVYKACMTSAPSLIQLFVVQCRRDLCCEVLQLYSDILPARIQVCNIVSPQYLLPTSITMGYIANEKSVVDFCESKTESLSNWVRQVKSKSLNAKTKRKRDLRIIAILSNSLSRAESELLTKQRERARRWAQMQVDLGLSSKHEEMNRQHREKIDNLWKNDLSGLDSFFKELDNVKPMPK